MKNLGQRQVSYGTQEPAFFENLVNRYELAKRLSLSPSYISMLMKYESLPYYKIGRSTRFKLSEVMGFLERRRNL